MAASKAAAYERLARELSSLLGAETNFVANAAQFSSFVYHALADLNWAGFYVRHGGELVLGPFQGKPACTRIPLGRGVCGTSAKERRTIVVPDVHQFPGHIACDPDSRSELVVPLVVDDEVIGLFDLDSALPGRFDADDEAGIERLVGVFLQHTSTAGVGDRQPPAR